MSIGLIFLMSFVTVAAFMVTASRIKGFQWLVDHSTIVDISFTIGTALILSGTGTGILTAILAGLMMAVFLTVVKKVQSFKLTRKTACIDDEHDENGNWIYNKAPYL